MKLKTVAIKDFRSIRNSNKFDIDNITCLVGKNESGKTALLQALYKLNPIISNDKGYDITDDYPRCDVEDYRIAIDNKECEHTVVCEAQFHLEQEEIDKIEKEFGDNNILQDHTLVLERDYDNTLLYSLNVDEVKVIKYFVEKAQIPTDIANKYSSYDNLESLNEEIQNSKDEHLVRLKGLLQPMLESGGAVDYVYNIIDKFVPKFLYFDEYYQMRGHENIDALSDRQNQNQLKDCDRPLLGLIELARLNFDQLLNPQRTQNLKNKLEGAGNHLTKKMLKYWSQNKNLSMRFDVRPGQSGDPEGMQNGTNIWAEIYDSRHLATTSIGKRSRGFVWFFSFLSFFEQQKKNNAPMILLLDEPGLSLHGKAQGDLLRYIEEELQGTHQIIYSTHSPFMVDSSHFERVRIVQDMGADSDNELSVEEDGTKVISDILLATEDTLFPLQGALGYELHQTLFVGPNCLLVEGVSDLLYIQTMSGILNSKEKTSLSEKWVITPVGGAGRLPMFVSLLGSQQNIKIATALDIDKSNKQMLDNLLKHKLLIKKNLLTFGDILNNNEADIEDMFDKDFYIDLVNAEFKNELSVTIKKNQLGKQPRILKAIGTALKKSSQNIQFNHYRPARYFAENISSLEAKLSNESLKHFETLFSKLNSIL